MTRYIYDRSVSVIKWLIHGDAQYCIVGTNDGILLSLDVNGDISAIKYLGVANAVRSIELIGNLVLCSLDDQSLRGWLFDPVGGKLVDALGLSNFHSTTCVSALCAIPLARSKNFVLVSGGDMGHFRISIVTGLD